MISIIAAVGQNLELGLNNELIWHLKKDMKHFKNMTMGKKVVMGKNTYLSLPGVLKGRTYIILSSSLKDIPEVMIYHDFNELLDFINSLDEEVMIIGGASIYELFLPYADNLYLTEIEDSHEADAYFPEFNKEDYIKFDDEEPIIEDDITYRLVRYKRRCNDEKR